MRKFLPFIILLLTVLTAAGQRLSFRQLTVENGLSQNAVMCITQDKPGFMWYGTRYGLNRYDGIRFKVYKNSKGDTTSLTDNVITCLLTDSDGNLWVGTLFGLCRYDEQKDAFTRVNLIPNTGCYIGYLYEDAQKTLWVGTNYGLMKLTDKAHNTFTSAYPQIPVLHTKGNLVRCIYQSSDGYYWVSTSRSLLCLDGKGVVKTYQSDTSQAVSQTNDYITSIAEDRQHRLWAGSLHSGLKILDANRNFVPFKNPASENVFNHNVRKILPAKDGRLWIAAVDGIVVIDPVTMQINAYQHDPEIKTSLSNNSVHSLYQDRFGTMWVGTYHGGINLVYSYTTPFTIFQNDRSVNSISSNVISSIKEDAAHNLWIGTEGGGLNYYNTTTNSFSSFKTNGGAKGALSSNLIKAIYVDRQGFVWIGTSYGSGLNLYQPKQNTFQHILVTREDKNSGSFDEILAVSQTIDGTIWVGSVSGLTELKQAANGSYPSATQVSSLNKKLPNKIIQALYEDSRHCLWIGTAGGLCVYDPVTKAFTAYKKNDSLATALQTDNVNTITEDSKGNIWVGTFYGGASVFDPKTKQFHTYTDKQGLSNNNVVGILEDNERNMWLSTDNGLTKFNIQQQTFKTYTTSDGIASNKFNNSAVLKDSKGKLYFGGINGVSAFYPDKLETNTVQPPVQITGVELFGSPVNIHDKTGLLNEAIGFTKNVSFKYDQSNFTIDFAVLNFIKPEKNKYAYKLEGIDPNWNYTTNTSATYANLPAGKYTFLVKGANNDGVWTNEPARLLITIRPPVWKTWYAYTLYVLFAGALVFFLLRFLYLRALYKKEHELQQFKLNFFTNVSHEIRTHLSLISAPVEKLMQEAESTTQKKQLEHVKTNADKLVQLVGELIEFRKAETNNLPLHVSKENIVSFVTDIHASFTDLAVARNIHASIEYTNPQIDIYFDRLQMEKVVFNLLSNAFKFTPDNGKVIVRIIETKETVDILVADNGKGIDKEHLKNIFANFFQVNDDPASNTGYGIGLALSKSIVELHKGNLSVTSEQPIEGKEGNTVFAVSLLKGHSHFDEKQLRETISVAATSLKPIMPVAVNAVPAVISGKRPLLVLVEDNVALRSFLKDSLIEEYDIVECEHGQEGLQAAFEHMPDLVISDVMMPELDGFNFCRILKEDIRTSHIPVVLLTAKAGHENHLTGLQQGADLYIAKPFSLQLVQLQLKNLLATREAMRLRLSTQLLQVQEQNAATADTQEDSLQGVSATDKAFLQQLLEIIDEQMDNPEFNVAMLSVKMALSQPILYKKVKALTNMTVNDFVKSLRLKKAATLLLDKEMNISEVAYSVGFNRRKYFSEEFKKVYGKTPTEYVNEHEG